MIKAEGSAYQSLGRNSILINVDLVLGSVAVAKYKTNDRQPDRDGVGGVVQLHVPATYIHKQRLPTSRYNLSA